MPATDDIAERRVAAKYRRRARAAQPAWAASPLAARIDAIRSFRDALYATSSGSLPILTSETGKPIRQARNEINGLPGRIDFFLRVTRIDDRAARSAQRCTACASRSRTSRSASIANISAWNYPYFVGGNVFVPALLTGNAVLYKPSEFAALTGLEIGKLLHAGGRARRTSSRCWSAVATVGAELIKQPVDGVFFTGSYATGQRIARELGPRMVKLQLELGGKDPIYVREDVDVAKPRRRRSPTARCTTPGRAAARSSASTCIRRSTRTSSRRSSRRSRASSVGDPADEATYIGPLTRAPQLEVLERQVADAVGEGRQAAARRQRASPHPATGSRRRC